jgi:hypothetical protein
MRIPKLTHADAWEQKVQGEKVILRVRHFKSRALGSILMGHIVLSTFQDVWPQ